MWFGSKIGVVVFAAMGAKTTTIFPKPSGLRLCQDRTPFMSPQSWKPNGTSSLTRTIARDKITISYPQEWVTKNNPSQSWKLKTNRKGRNRTQTTHRWRSALEQHQWNLAVDTRCRTGDGKNVNCRVSRPGKRRSGGVVQSHGTRSVQSRQWKVPRTAIYSQREIVDSHGTVNGSAGGCKVCEGGQCLQANVLENNENETAQGRYHCCCTQNRDCRSFAGQEQCPMAKSTTPMLCRWLRPPLTNTQLLGG